MMASQVLRLRLLVDGRENLLQARDVPLGLGFVLGEGSLELRQLRGFLHFGKGGKDFLLREVDVLQRVVE